MTVVWIALAEVVLNQSGSWKWRICTSCFYSGDLKHVRHAFVSCHRLVTEVLQRGRFRAFLLSLKANRKWKCGRFGANDRGPKHDTTSEAFSRHLDICDISSLLWQQNNYHVNSRNWGVYYIPCVQEPKRTMWCAFDNSQLHKYWPQLFSSF